MDIANALAQVAQLVTSNNGVKKPKAGPFTAKYSEGDGLVKFTQFCDAFGSWCNVAYPTNSLSTMSGIHAAYVVQTEELADQDSIIFGKLVAALITAGASINAAIMQHKTTTGIRSGHLLFRDVRVAYWGGIDEYKGAIDAAMSAVVVNDKNCIASFFQEVGALQKATIDLGYDKDALQWEQCVTNALFKNEKLKTAARMLCGRKFSLSEMQRYTLQVTARDPDFAKDYSHI